MSAIDECIRFVRGEGFGLLANRATDELAQLRARIEELESGLGRLRELFDELREYTISITNLQDVVNLAFERNWTGHASYAQDELAVVAKVRGLISASKELDKQHGSDVILTIHRGGHKDQCEWNPATNAPAKSDEPTHAEAAFIVGANGDWRLCARCVSLPRFARFKVHRTIHRGGTTEAK